MKQQKLLSDFTNPSNNYSKMIVTIKFIAGQEIDLEVESSFTISCLKELVSRQFHVPVEQQRLVFKGKILADAQCLCDYNIVAGTKLHLTVKKAEPRNYVAEDEKAREKLIAQLRICLKPHFVPNDVEKIVEQFSQDLDKQVVNSSLDDIERVASPNQGPTPSDNNSGASKAGLLPVKNTKKT